MVLLTGNRGFNQISGNALIQREGIIYYAYADMAKDHDALLVTTKDYANMLNQ